MLVEKAETASTNDDARALARDGAPHGAAVLARRQLAGRGRDGRVFASPEGGMYLSIVLRPRAPPARWGLLPLGIGVGVVDALAEFGFRTGLKWPNDVMLHGRKAGGILVEAHFDAAPYAVAGIGLNLRAAPPEAPEATALAEYGAPPDARIAAEAVRARVLEAARALDEAPDALHARAREACVTLGRAVTWDGGEGVAVDLDADGALVVERASGRARIVAGDVRVREKR